VWAKGKIPWSCKYIDQLEKETTGTCVDAIQGYTEVIATQSETTEAMKNTTNYQSKTIDEPNKKARNPNTVTGGKRARPLGSKSKAVSFGADAMPDNDLVS
jgi:hypothetical protein